MVGDGLWTPHHSLPLFNSQYINYDENSLHVEKSISTLKNKDPLVSESSIKKLGHILSEVDKSSVFIIQAGPCVELFEDANNKTMHELLGMFSEMGSIFSSRKVIFIGRFAGQVIIE